MGTRRVQRKLVNIMMFHYDTCWFKGKPNRCDMFGHIAKDCNSKVKQLVHHAKHVEEETSMFYACHFVDFVKKKNLVFDILIVCSIII